MVAARLADARFFFEEDRKRGLEGRAADLPHLAFHVKQARLRRVSKELDRFHDDGSVDKVVTEEHEAAPVEAALDEASA